MLLTTEVLAQKFGVTTGRIRQVKDELGLNPQRVGNVIIYSKAEAKLIKNRLDEFANSGRGKPRLVEKEPRKGKKL